MRRNLALSILGIVVCVVPSALFLLFASLIIGVYALHWGAVQASYGYSYYWNAPTLELDWKTGFIGVPLPWFIVFVAFFLVLVFSIMLFRRERQISKNEKARKQKDANSGMVV